MCIYIIYLFKTIVSKAWPSSSVPFLIINIIFHEVSITWILKVSHFYLAVKLACLNMLFLFVNKQLCYSRQNKNVSIILLDLLYLLTYEINKIYIIFNVCVYFHQPGDNLIDFS